MDKRIDGWWFKDPQTKEDVGPYETRAEAEDDYRGLKNFYKLFSSILAK